MHVINPYRYGGGASPAALTYPQTVIADGPVAYWRLGEPSGGTSADESGNDLHIVWNPTDEPTRGYTGAIYDDYSTAVYFDGTDDFGTFPDTADTTPAAVTVEVWVRMEANGISGATLYDRSDSVKGIALGMASTTTYGVFMLGNWRVSCPAPIDGQWHHLVATYSAADEYLRLYFDGFEADSYAYSTPLTWTSTRHQVGKYDSSNEYKGFASDLAVYDAVLTAEQVLTHFQAGVHPHVAAVLGHDPILYVQFDRLLGTVDYDYSAEKNDLLWGNTADITSGLISDRWGKCREFNGSTDNLGVASPNTQPDGAMAVSFWVETEDNSDATIVENISAGSAWDTDGFHVYIDSDGYVVFEVRDTSTYSLQGTVAVNDNEPHFIVCAFDGDEQVIYIDAAEDVSQSSSSHAAGTFAIDIGASVGNPGGTTQYYDGKLDHLAVFNKNLTLSEVQALFTAGGSLKPYPAAVLANSPVAYWRLGGSPTWDNPDNSGNDHDLSWTNDPTSYPIDSALLSEPRQGCQYFGGSDVGSFPDHADFSPAAVSVEAWMKFPTTVDTSGDILDRAAATQGYSMEMAAGPVIKFIINGAAETSYTYPDDDVWHHVVGTYSTATGVRFYFDGDLVDEAAYSTALSYTATASTIGTSILAYLDEIAVYDTALTADDVQDHYNAAMLLTNADTFYGVIDTASPVNWWRMDDFSGTTCSDTAGTDDMTYVDTPTLNSTGGVGNSPAVVFNGSSEYAYDPSPGYLANAIGSVEILAKITDTTSGGAQALFSVLDSTTDTDYLVVYCDTGGLIRMELYTGAGNNSVKTGFTLSDATWYHVTVTADGSEWKVYINGAEVPIAVHAGSNTGKWFSFSEEFDTASVGAMKRSSAINFLAGTLDEVVLYDRVLTATEIFDHYIKARDDSDVTWGLVNWWKLDEGAATTATDSGSGSNDGTLTSMGTETWIPAPEGVNSLPALEFDGAADFVNVSDVTSMDGSPWISFSAHINCTDVSVESKVISKYQASGNNRVYYLGVSAGGKLLAAYSTDGANLTYWLSDDAVLIDDTDHHIAAAANLQDASATLWVDGVAVDATRTGSSTGTLPNKTSPLYVGAMRDVASDYHFFPGRIADPRTYNRLLNTSEVVHLSTYTG